VRNADRAEMMIQCLGHELGGSGGLDDLWDSMDRRGWHSPLCSDLYGRLKGMQPGNK
jgi:hypothetical protein